MVWVRMTVADSTLPHQIRLREHAMKPGGKMTKVTCICLSAREHIAIIEPTADPWVHYNDPEKHNNDIPFVPGMWRESKVYDI